tara:strand:+ start:85 stop:789 length:705 start_codon:yes stop_codon:yes gene_type:complete
LAYSLKALSAEWVDQPVIRANRVADNVDLEVTAAEITDGTLVAFSQGGDVSVKTIFDQSGGTAHNAFPDTSTKRRLIVDTGVLVTEGGEPAMSGSIYHYNIGGGGIALTGDFSILTLANLNASNALFGPTSGTWPRIRFFTEQLEIVNDAGGEINITNTDETPTFHNYDGSRALTGIYRNADSVDVTIAGQAVASGPLTLSGTFTFDQIFAYGADVQPVTGKFQEMIIWPSDIR